MKHLNVFVSPLTTAFGVFKAASCVWFCKRSSSLAVGVLGGVRFSSARCSGRLGRGAFVDYPREQRATATSLPRLWSKRPTWSIAEVEGYLCGVAGVFICLGLCHVVLDAALDVIEYGSRLVGGLFFPVTAFGGRCCRRCSLHNRGCLPALSGSPWDGWNRFVR